MKKRDKPQPAVETKSRQQGCEAAKLSSWIKDLLRLGNRQNLQGFSYSATEYSCSICQAASDSVDFLKPSCGLEQVVTATSYCRRCQP